MNAIEIVGDSPSQLTNSERYQVVEILFDTFWTEMIKAWVWVGNDPDNVPYNINKTEEARWLEYVYYHENARYNEIVEYVRDPN